MLLRQEINLISGVLVCVSVLQGANIWIDGEILISGQLSSQRLMALRIALESDCLYSQVEQSTI